MNTLITKSEKMGCPRKGMRQFMRVAICDDSIVERENLNNMLVNTIKHISVSEFDCGYGLLEEHEKTPFDLIFLDILMPKINGIETAEKLREKDKSTPIVFVSTSEEFGVLSYRVLAFDYILKPLKRTELSECLKRFLSTRVKKHYITINFSGVETKILLSNIVYLESNLKKIIIHMIEGREITVVGKLSEYEEFLLLHNFCRCHKSFLVNIEHIESVMGEEFNLTQNISVKISRGYRNEAKKAYFDYVFGNERS